MNDRWVNEGIMSFKKWKCTFENNDNYKKRQQVFAFIHVITLLSKCTQNVRTTSHRNLHETTTMENCKFVTPKYLRHPYEIAPAT